MTEIVIPDPPGTGGYTSTTIEMGVQRRLTRWFISTQPVVVTLTPRVRVRQAGGGMVWTTGEDRDPQTLRLVEPSSSGAGRPTVTADGVEREIAFQLLGEWDASIGMYDIFSLNDFVWEVAQLLPFNGWERRASVARYG